MTSALGGLGAGFPGSVHHDVLVANPETPDDTSRLLDELKSRGRSAVSSKDYGSAELLYSKGIELMEQRAKNKSKSNKEEGDDTPQQLAILYSNRSLCRLNMNKLGEAQKDALEATQLDPTYVKSHWRLGQALTALERTEEAKEAFEVALSLDPSSKALQKEVQKLEQKLEQEEQLLVEDVDDDDIRAAAATTPKSKPIKKSALTSTSKTATSSTSSAKKPAEATTPTTTSAAAVEDGIFTKSDHVRGYKIVDGKKTSYFHNELTEDAKRLIGDIAPKKLDTASPEAAARKDTDGKSAWNQAGTWEERDVTAWARDTLKACLLSNATFELPPGSPDMGAVASIGSVTKCDGHASFATVRGKKRYIYEFHLELMWQVQLSSGKTAKGVMEIPDFDGTCELGEGYEVTGYSVDSSTPSETRHFLDRFVKNGGLRDAIFNTLDDWVGLFRATY